jgi:hypothetical protein
LIGFAAMAVALIKIDALAIASPLPILRYASFRF